MFSGGALEQISIFALGIMPYISASHHHAAADGGGAQARAAPARRASRGGGKINQYTRYGTIVLALVQAFFIARWLSANNTQYGQYGEVVPDPGWDFHLITMISLTTGTAFIMWLGEQITERGIGNGISLIIFAGIVCDMPDAPSTSCSSKAQAGEITAFDPGGHRRWSSCWWWRAIIFFERGQRRIPVQYAKRHGGPEDVRRAVDPPAAQGEHRGRDPADLRLVDPDVPAADRLVRPARPGCSSISDALHPGDWRYNVIYVALIVFFCYFYTAVTFNPVDVADNMKKHGGFIPGIRPGKATADYIDHVLTRITFGGALYVSAVCVLPTHPQQQLEVPFQFGGTGLLIVVGVALDTVQQIESHLITRNYEGFAGPKGPRIRGRTARVSGPVGA